MQINYRNTVFIALQSVLFGPPFFGNGSALPSWRTGKNVKGRCLFYHNFQTLFKVIQFHRMDLRTSYTFPNLCLVAISLRPIDSVVLT